MAQKNERHDIQDAMLKDVVRAHPELILEDPSVMQALVQAFDATRGDNIIDMRTMAMQKLELRLDRLEDNHRTVVATAFENMSGMQQIHRAALELGRHNDDIHSFFEALDQNVPQILRIQSICVLCETRVSPQVLAPAKTIPALRFVPVGSLQALTSGGGGFPRQRILMQAANTSTQHFHGKQAHYIGSEASITLDLGAQRLPAMLLMGAQDPNTFSASKGTALLEFFADFVETQLIRFLKE